MKTQMTKLSLIVLAVTLFMATSAGAVVLMDQSTYDVSVPGFLNSVAGAPPMGSVNYSLNDVTVDGSGWVITSISTYFNALGGFEEVSLGYLNIFPKTGPLPVDGVDVPTNDVAVTLTVTHIEGDNYEVTASGLNIELSPGEYWIGITPFASSFNPGIHLASPTLIGDATPTMDPNGFPMPMWMAWNPGVDAAMLIIGLDDVVATEDINLDAVKSLYR